MWLNQGLECAVEMGSNYSKLYENNFDYESQERQQLILRDLCTSTIPFPETRCKNTSSFSVALLAIVWAFNTSGVLLSFFLIVFTIRFRKNRIVKMSSPNLNVVTLLGSGLIYGSVYLFGIEKQNPLSRPSLEMLIQVRICILYISGSLVLGPILGKSWRLYRVFTQKVPDKRVIIKDFQLLVMLLLLVLADIILLFIWISLDPVQCLQNLNVDVKVTDKGLSYTLSYGYVCKSLYSEFWFILLLGFKGILLIYGIYLAGLTDNLSCPPVNQSLTLISAVAIIFLFIGIMLVVNSFFYLWHNLIYGLTSGGIFVCMSSINCLIFIPQIRQWKTFEKQEVDTSNMAKYFTGSNKNFHSTMYSDEEIYQLLGEKNTMAQQLTEKDTAIANLQEQMNTVKEKLMRLVAIEQGSPTPGPWISTRPRHATTDPHKQAKPHLQDAGSTQNHAPSGLWKKLSPHNRSLVPKRLGTSAIEDNHSVVGSPFLSMSHLLPSHSTANFSSMATENLPFSFSQELKPLQNSKLSNSQYLAGLLSKKRSIDDLEHTDQENISLDITAKCKLVNKKNSGAKYDEDQWFSQSSTLLTREKLHEHSFSTLSKGARQQHFSALNQKQSPEVSSPSNKKIQKILQDLSENHITITQPFSRELKYNYERRMILQPKKIGKKVPFNFSSSMASSIQCGVNKSASRMQRMSRLIEYPSSAPRSTEDGDSLHQLPPLPSLMLKNSLQTKPDSGFGSLYNEGYGLLLDNHLVGNYASTLYPTNMRNFHYQQKDFLTRAIPGLSPLQHFYFDSGSSSSGERAYCHQTQACEICHCSLSSSSDSCMIDTDPEYSTLDYARRYSKAKQIVNFNEDLEPTYV
ncbi:probable G-protein coupled receptor 156 isoform X2 [Crotalus tigris]|uniref:probable G-protein coupled receptor 156 isoform X2 n=1 Tax=Crotalus tigris TaxID=88082 RepID=UPI00192F2CC5|nr:probable G-protein coupled receptor 156 isoform X2 [Crotalus tigris]